jgi:FdhD protein
MIFPNLSKGKRSKHVADCKDDPIINKPKARAVMANRIYQARKYNKGIPVATDEPLTVEEALQIDINGTPFTVSMRTPGHDVELVTGMLYCEGVLEDKTFMPDIELEEAKDGIVQKATVSVPPDKLGDGYASSRSLLSVSSCGICGKTELSDLQVGGDPLGSDRRVDIHVLSSLFDKMNQYQFDFNSSGATHAAAAFTAKGELLCVKEDIGRHNAVDKVIGWLLLNDRLGEAQILTVSGRVSYEIVVKCFKGKMPVLAAVSAPSSLAVDFAKELGITLFGFCRDQRATCYAHPHRIMEPNIEKINRH